MLEGFDVRTTRESARDEPWVIVAGGFHERGGMDKANAALAAHLLARGTPLHLVAHAVAPELASHALATVHLVARPAGSYLLGEQLLSRKGRAVARSVKATWPRARVVVNGGNCAWPDINWVHSVHHAWPPSDAGAPVWFRLKNRLTGAASRRRERRAVCVARIVVANSERTRRDLIELLGVSPERIYTVRLGGDARRDEVAATNEERAAARARLGARTGRPLVAFVGALGHDHNKGFDTLMRAWGALCARAEWDVDLVAAGGGRAVEEWRARVASAGLDGRVRLLGHTDRVAEDVLAASDLLVSPVRYEAYGLNVHEAICRGVPALVSACAGVAELYPRELARMLLPRADDAEDLAARLLGWRAEVEEWKRRFAPFADTLRSRTWHEMAAEFVSVVEGDSAAGASRAAGEAHASRAPETRGLAGEVFR